jgi:hypothetical protein
VSDDDAKVLRDLLRARHLTQREREALRRVLIAAGKIGSLVRVPGAIPREEPVG